MNNITKIGRFTPEQMEILKNFFFQCPQVSDPEEIMGEFENFLSKEFFEKEVEEPTKKFFATLEIAKKENPQISYTLARFGAVIFSEFRLYARSLNSKETKENVNNLEFERIKEWFKTTPKSELLKVPKVGEKIFLAMEFLFANY